RFATLGKGLRLPIDGNSTHRVVDARPDLDRAEGRLRERERHVAALELQIVLALLVFVVVRDRGGKGRWIDAEYFCELFHCRRLFAQPEMEQAFKGLQSLSYAPIE